MPVEHPWPVKVSPLTKRSKTCFQKKKGTGVLTNPETPVNTKKTRTKMEGGVEVKEGVVVEGAHGWVGSQGGATWPRSDQLWLHGEREKRDREQSESVAR